MFATDPATGTTTTVHAFNGADGSDPLGQLLVAPDGALWGTTRYAGNGCAMGCGEIYRITTGGAFSIVHVMTDLEGGTLQGGLVTGPDGRLYGTATTGGSLICHNSSTGCGSVYAVTPATGAITVLHAFNLTDGKAPYGRLVLASDGYFYGTTSTGGSPRRHAVPHPPRRHRVHLPGLLRRNAGRLPTQGGAGAKTAASTAPPRSAGPSAPSNPPGPSTPRRSPSRASTASTPTATPRPAKAPPANCSSARDGYLYGTTRLGGTSTSDPNRAGPSSA